MEVTRQVAWYYPRLKKVSFNGGRMVDEKEAIKYINSIIK